MPETKYLISNQAHDRFLSGRINFQTHEPNFFWAEVKENSFPFASAAQAIEFEDTQARDFLENELTDILLYDTLESIYSRSG